MPDITTIILDAMNALQTLHRTITTVQAPPVEQYPTVIDTTNGQPFAMTWPGEGEAWQKGHGYDQAIMTYRVIVFIDPVAQNDIPSHAADGALLLQQFINLYTKASNTPQAAPPPYQLTIQSGPDGLHIRHGGLVPTLSFGGRQFFGFELQVPVRVEWIQ